MQPPVDTKKTGTYQLDFNLFKFYNRSIESEGTLYKIFATSPAIK